MSSTREEPTGSTVSPRKVDCTKDKMEEFMFLDKALLEKDIICNICSRHLNVPPIMYSEEFGNMCGRCNVGTTFSNLGSLSRQQAYENLIKNLTFPCVNKNYGCLDVLKYVDVQTHESTCRFQCTHCPLYCKQLFGDTTCTWTGTTALLNDHLRTHRDSFMDPPQFDWPTKGKNKIFFTSVGNQIVTVVIKHEIEDKYVALVMVNGTDLESQCFRYQLELSNENKTNSLILRRNRLEPVTNFLDLLRCPEKTLEVDIEKIWEMLQNPAKVCAKFGIVKKNKKEIAQVTGNKDSDVLAGASTMPFGKEKHALPDEDMLAELECPVCNEFMVPPIYICPTGHSVCNDCKGKVQDCPTCRKPLGEGRNFTLEKLTSKVKYPCVNREIGCGFVTTSDKIKQHQIICELTENKCVLKCGWKGSSPALYNHFLLQHTDRVKENNVSWLMNFSEKRTFNYFFCIMGKIFCFTIMVYNKYNIRYNLQHVGHVGPDPAYKYSVQLFASDNSTIPNIAMTNFCQGSDTNLSDALGHGSVLVPGDLMKYYTSKYLFCIKVNITKI